jgi:hypothetical protein
LPVPQDVPFGAFPDSRHTGAPVLQTVIPTRQGFPATTQLDPATHAAHEPAASQTMSLPHEVPGATFIAVSAQEDVAPEQTRAPL